MGSEMDTFAARLASFDIVLKPEKRRSSGTKSPKAVSWPHQRPSPAELAHAGFYYKPYETNPDNTTCFECHRALDGWEEDDNPVTEHLKHAPDCGWAIMMDIQQNSSNPASIEDPTSDRITQARYSTFGSAWPHDGKRGWVCQSQKMVEAGWYFCPTDESNDLASCVYCKLSLDGWEPKDDPFDEHYRRSSDCSFFVFAQPPGKKGKGSKAKKPRVSKASSRLSTQSVTSEAPEMDMDDSMDQSILSQATTKSKSTKKATKGKSKASKTKQEEPTETETQDGIDVEEAAQPEPSKPKRGAKGKKRASEDIKDEPEPTYGEEEPSQPPVEPPAKRRATKTRSSSVARKYDYEHSDSVMADADPVGDVASDDEPKRGRKPAKKASRSRKASDVSASSKAQSMPQGPPDSEIDAQIEAGLQEDIPEPAEDEPEQPKPSSKKTKSSKKSKASAKSPEPVEQQETEDFEESDGRPGHEDVVAIDDEPEVFEPPAPKAKAAKGSKKKSTKKAKAQETVEPQSPEARQSPDAAVEEDNGYESGHHESLVAVEIISKNPDPKPAAEEQVAKPEKKSSKKKEASAKEKKSKKSEKKVEQPPVPQPPVEEPHDVESPMDEQDDEFDEADDLPDQLELVNPPRQPSPAPREPSIQPESSPQPQSSHRKKSSLPPKTAKRYSDIPQEEHLTENLINQSSPQVQEPRRTSQRSNQALSPPPHQSTPSPSPQSSDAENRPPSSRPSSARPPVQSTPKHPEFRAAVTASTPSPSKRNPNAGFGPSGHPWTPVDIDEALFGEASDKENADLSDLFKGVKGGLTSPEKKMTVQEWITWNAKNSEDRLKRECERLVGQFEKEGARALRRIEAIECID
ncbi:unnamed protein product [Penicillium salamii]|uniref:Chromosome segregation protein BIR1 n=1 Tax=Penicillium salamii TaxID=1612424 RepID=A0A9W4NFA5_9EURO|nr:unnamed protein product [Penicillium salamii]CAG8366449.1 unnamed protein product [Penicillium salamii]CAG8386488.1 unnamed protein product [Penicillium salamii]CAG8389317.1 unnamed protein product [Penicillium salamii]